MSAQPNNQSNNQANNHANGHANERHQEHDPEHGIMFWIGLLIGGAIVAFAMRGVLHQFATGAARYRWARYVVGADLVHDLIIAPLVFLVAYGARHIVAPRFRGPLAFGVYGSAVMIAIGWYPLHGTAHYKQNVSFQPLNYATAVTTTVVVVWCIAAIWTVLLMRKRPSDSPTV